MPVYATKDERHPGVQTFDFRIQASKELHRSLADRLGEVRSIERPVASAGQQASTESTGGFRGVLKSEA